MTGGTARQTIRAGIEHAATIRPVELRGTGLSVERSESPSGGTEEGLGQTDEGTDGCYGVSGGHGERWEC